MVEQCDNCHKTFKKFKIEEREENLISEGKEYNATFIVYICPLCKEECYTVLKEYEEVYKEVVANENTSIT